MRPAVACLLVLVTAGAAAGEIPATAIERQGARYVVMAEALLHTPPADVYARLTDFEHLNRLHSTVSESAPLPGAAPGWQRVRVLSQACVLFFCYDLLQILDYRLETPEDLQAVIVPADTDFRSGRLRWRMAPGTDGGTHLRFEAELEPAFWVPPLIGPWILKQKLVSMASGIVENLEQQPKEESR